MVDSDVQGLKIAVQEAAAKNQTHLRLPIDLIARLGAEVEARAIEYQRLMEAVDTALRVIAKWRTAEIDASAAMQAICGAAEAWTGSKS
jgi:hypothetical protein